MSGIDPSILVVGMLAVGIVATVLLWPRGNARPAPSGRPAHPGRALIDHFEEVGKDAAGRIIADRLGMTHAESIGEKFTRAFAPTPAPAPAPAPPTVPNQ